MQYSSASWCAQKCQHISIASARSKTRSTPEDSLALPLAFCAEGFALWCNSLRSVLSLYCCKFICWCLEYSSCCDYLLCCHCVLCLPATVTCSLIVQEASVLHKEFQYTAGSACPCAWHQERATCRYVLAAFLCSIAEHEVQSL